MRFCNYYLLEALQSGGMAEIWAARSLRPDRPSEVVALKRILPHLWEDRDATAMFRDEAELMATLAHPNICHVSDFGTCDGRAFMAMELIRGQDLRAIARRARDETIRPPQPFVAFVALRMAEALEAVHNHRNARGKPLRIVHRDVSPQNILISYDGVPKLIDFGIATSTQRRSNTESGMVKGNFRFLAPEQIDGGDTLDGRADIYSLGVTLYETLVGHSPYRADTEAVLLARIISGIREPIDAAGLDLSPQIVRIIERSMAHNPRSRYPTAGAMAADLAHYLDTLGTTIDEHSAARYVRKLFKAEAELADKKLTEYTRMKLPRAAAGPKPQADEPTVRSSPRRRTTRPAVTDRRPTRNPMDDEDTAVTRRPRSPED